MSPRKQGVVSGWWLQGKRLSPGQWPDRGLQFGDGLFETMASCDGRVPLLARHLDRLEQGAERLGLPWPGQAAIRTWLERLPVPAGPAVVKLVMSTVGGRGYSRPRDAEARVYLGLFPRPKLPDACRVVHCRLRLARQPMLAGIKHLNRLEQVLARREADAAGADEGLLCDSEGLLVEAIAANLFVARDGVLLTPALDQAGVNGIMRAQVMELALEEGVESRVTHMRPEDILSSDGLFLTNSLWGIRPVTELNGETRNDCELTWHLKAILNGKFGLRPG
jgi:4-amino-4-deoxychorismate lyase